MSECDTVPWNWLSHVKKLQTIKRLCERRVCTNPKTNTNSSPAWTYHVLWDQCLLLPFLWEVMLLSSSSTKPVQEALVVGLAWLCPVMPWHYQPPSSRSAVKVSGAVSEHPPCDLRVVCANIMCAIYACVHVFDGLSLALLSHACKHLSWNKTTLWNISSQYCPHMHYMIQEGQIVKHVYYVAAPSVANV